MHLLALALQDEPIAQAIEHDWHNDINYHLAHKYDHPALLVADPRRTFIWNEPIIYLAHDHCRNYLKWSSLQELLALLRGVGR